MKVLMFDLEHGSQSIGSHKDIEKMFSYPVMEPSTWDQFQGTIAQIYTKANVEVSKKIGSLEIKEMQIHTVPKNGTVIDAVVIDTFSELSKKFMRTLTDRDGKMKLQQWGQLKNKLDGCLEFVSQIPGVVICTCHSKVQTMDDGNNKLIPYIDGSTKEDISKWIDFVFYTKTIVNAKNERAYVWVTKRSETYDHAKDRTDLLDTEIPQDYQLVMDAAKKKGWPGARILIIGSPGSGKTRSLQTLIKETK